MLSMSFVVTGLYATARKNVIVVSVHLTIKHSTVIQMSKVLQGFKFKLEGNKEHNTSHMAPRIRLN